MGRLRSKPEKMSRHFIEIKGKVASSYQEKLSLEKNTPILIVYLGLYLLKQNNTKVGWALQSLLHDVQYIFSF